MSLRTSRQLAVHHNTRDSDTLLPSSLANRMEARTEEEFSEDVLNRISRYAWPVVLANQFEPVSFQPIDFYLDVR